MVINADAEFSREYRQREEQFRAKAAALHAKEAEVRSMARSMVDAEPDARGDHYMQAYNLCYRSSRTSLVSSCLRRRNAASP